MAAEVDICNTSLAYLGDDATVVSLDPPEGSAQASHCARFYPLARDALLEMHTWGFATRRGSLALLSEAPPSTWLYAYALPSDMVNAISVLAPDATDDNYTGIPLPVPVTSSFYDPSSVPPHSNIFTPQPYVIETGASGEDVLYTNQVNAVLRYTGSATDPTRFTPLFTEALAWFLAAKLAGPVLKGQAGREAALECLKQFQLWFAKASASDANQRKVAPVEATAPWISGR